MNRKAAVGDRCPSAEVLGAIAVLALIYLLVATLFFPIPVIGTGAINFTLGISGLFAGGLLFSASSSLRQRHARLAVLAALLALQMAMVSPARADEPFDTQIRARMLGQKDGLVAHLETVYNDIFVAKYQSMLKMAFQWKGWYFQQSEVNLTDPFDLSVLYSRVMSLAAIYPPQIKRVLVIGLGGGSIPVYLDHFLPGATIDTAEVDSGVIDAGRKYFGLRETKRFRLIESDGRVFLNRHTEPYDLILVDAFTGSYIPFHLMTKEFYQLVRSRLAPHGVAAFNFLPIEKLFESNVRTLQLTASNLDFFNSGDESLEWSNVIVIERLDTLTEAEILQRAAAAQARYKFRFDVSRLVTERRIPAPEARNGKVLTDDFAPADVLGDYGRASRREK